MSVRSAARGNPAAKSIRFALRTSSIVATSSANFSRCVLRWLGSRRLRSALMLSAIRVMPSTIQVLGPLKAKSLNHTPTPAVNPDLPETDGWQVAQPYNYSVDHIVPALFAKDPEMTLRSMAGTLAWSIERPFKYLLLASVLVPLVILILVAVIDRDHLIEAATTEARKTVNVLNEHTLKVMETQELALNQIDDRTRGMSWEEIATSEVLFQDLRRLVARLPQIDGAFLIRPDGEIAMTSRVFPVPSISFADRDYFQAQLTTDAGFFVGRAYIGKISHHPIFNVSQRRRGGNEGFDGVVGISLSTEYFSRFYQSIAEYDGAAVALGRTDGEVLARYPLLEKPLMRFAPDGVLMRGLAAGREQWTDIAASPQDGVERIFA